jgi:hypothetical protein
MVADMQHFISFLLIFDNKNSNLSEKERNATIGHKSSIKLIVEWEQNQKFSQI